MTYTVETIRQRGPAGRVGRSLLYAIALVPMAVLALAAALCGRSATAAKWWFRLGDRVLGVRTTRVAGRPGFAAVAGHALLSAGLAAVAVMLWGIDVLFVIRGVFYGFVDHGPYNHSWGGPTRGGAWLMHFLISFPSAIAAAGLLVGIVAVHRRLTEALAGARPAPWLIPVALLIPVPAVLFFIAWLHQI